MAEAGNRHDAGDDGHLNSSDLALVSISVKIFVVVEELSDDDVGSGIYFSLEVFNIGFGADRFGVFFGVASDSDSQRGKFGVQEVDKFVGVCEPAFGGLEGVVTVGDVSSNSDDIGDAHSSGFLDVSGDLFGGGLYAGQVGGDRDVGKGEDLGDGSKSAIPCAASGTVGAGNEVGVVREETLDVFVEAEEPLVRLGGEKFVGKHEFVFAVNV